MAVYVCSRCHFCFERIGAVDSCPDCACPSVRYATNEETEEYLRNKVELDNNFEQEKNKSSNPS